MFIGIQQRTGFGAPAKAADTVLALQHISFPVAPQANGGVFLLNFINKIHGFAGISQIGNIVPKENKLLGVLHKRILAACPKSVIIGMNIRKYGNFHSNLR